MINRRIARQQLLKVGLASLRYFPHAAAARRSLISASYQESLVQFVKKNIDLNQFVTHVPNDSPEVSALLAAVKQGDAGAAIFDHPDCYRYLLYLADKITPAEYMTVHVYLMALMQFTVKQPLSPNHEEMKSLRQVEIHPLVKDQQLTPLAENYLDQVAHKFAFINCRIDKEAFRRELLASSPVEQWLLLVRNANTGLKQNHATNYSADRLKEILYRNIPFLGLVPPILNIKNKAAELLVPSTSLINFFLHQVSPKPLRMEAVFGRLSKMTLRRFHETNRHPVAFYAPHVKSNLENVHQYRGGPFFHWLHDVGHTLWGSLFTPEEREVIFNIIIPFLEKVKTEAAKFNDLAIIDIIDTLINEICDYDLTPIEAYYPPYRLSHYLEIKRQYYPREDAHLFGAAAYDRILVLMHTLAQKETPAVASLLKPLLPSIWIGIWPDMRVIKALIQLAGVENTVTIANQAPVQIEWKKWIALLENTKDSEAIWDAARQPDLYSELLALINDHGLKFFHPYLPLTPQKHSELLRYARRQRQEQHREVIGTTLTSHLKAMLFGSSMDRHCEKGSEEAIHAVDRHSRFASR